MDSSSTHANEVLYLGKGVGWPIGRDVFVFHISHFFRAHKSQMKVTGCLNALIFNAIISLVFFLLLPLPLPWSSIFLPAAAALPMLIIIVVGGTGVAGVAAVIDKC